MAYRKLLLNSVGLILAGTLLSGCQTTTSRMSASGPGVVTITIKKVPGRGKTTLLSIPGTTKIACKGTDPINVHFVLAGTLSGKFANNNYIVIHDNGAVFTNITRVNDHLVTAVDNCSDKELYFKYDVLVSTDNGDVPVDPLLKNY